MKPIFLASKSALSLYVTGEDWLHTSPLTGYAIEKTILTERVKGHFVRDGLRVTSLLTALVLSLESEQFTNNYRLREQIILNPGYWRKGKFPNLVESDIVWKLNNGEQRTLLDSFIAQTLKGDSAGYLPYNLYYSPNALGSYTIKRS